MERITLGDVVLSRVGTAPDDPPPCTVCSGAEWVVNARFDPLHPDREQELLPCPACTADRLVAARRERLIGASGLELERDTTFATTLPFDWQAPAWEVGRAFAEQPTGWLWLWGANGAGKTLLTVCIGNAVLDAGTAVTFKTAKNLLDTVRATFGERDNLSQATWAAMLDAPVLLIDEYGKQHDTGWAQEYLFELLDHRWRRRFPTVVTTNRTLEQLTPDIRSRVMDATRVQTIHMEIGEPQ